MIQFIPFPGDYYSLVIKNLKNKKFFSINIENNLNKDIFSSKCRKHLVDFSDYLGDDEDYLKYLRLNHKYFIGFWLSEKEILKDIIENLDDYWLIFILADDLYDKKYQQILSELSLKKDNLFFLPISRILELFEFKLISSYLLFSFWEVAKSLNAAKSFYNSENLFQLQEKETVRTCEIPFLYTGSGTRFVLNKHFNSYNVIHHKLDYYNEIFNMEFDDYSEAVHFFNRMYLEQKIMIPGFEIIDIFLRTFIFEIIVFDIDLRSRLEENDRFIKDFFGIHPPAYGLINPEFELESFT